MFVWILQLTINSNERKYSIKSAYVEEGSINFSVSLSLPLSSFRFENLSLFILCKKEPNEMNGRMKIEPYLPIIMFYNANDRNHKQNCNLLWISELNDEQPHMFTKRGENAQMIQLLVKCKIKYVSTVFGWT